MGPKRFWSQNFTLFLVKMKTLVLTSLMLSNENVTVGIYYNIVLGEVTMRFFQITCQW